MINIINDKDKITFECKTKLCDCFTIERITFNKNKYDVEAYDDFEEIFDGQVLKYGLDTVFTHIHNISHEHIKFHNLINQYDKFYRMLFDRMIFNK